MTPARLPISGYALLLLAVLLLLVGLLNVLWYFIPPPGGLDGARARNVARREEPTMQVTDTRLDHCDRLTREVQPTAQPPHCGGQWVWLVETGNTCQGANSEAAWLLVDYQTGAITYKQVCGLS